MRTRPIIISIHLGWMLASLFLSVAAELAIAQVIESQPIDEYRTHVQVSPQFMMLNASGVQIQAYGGDFTMWYRLSKNWDAGMALQQVVGLRAGGTALMSAVNIKGRWHFWGGKIPSRRRWSRSGENVITQTIEQEGGFSLTTSLEQVTFNAGESNRSYNGLGLMVEYERSIFSAQSLVLGLGFARLSNGITKLIPVRLQAGWQIYFN